MHLDMQVGCGGVSLWPLALDYYSNPARDLKGWCLLRGTAVCLGASYVPPRGLLYAGIEGQRRSQCPNRLSFWVLLFVKASFNSDSLQQAFLILLLLVS